MGEHTQVTQYRLNKKIEEEPHAHTEQNVTKPQYTLPNLTIESRTGCMLIFLVVTRLLEK